MYKRLFLLMGLLIIQYSSLLFSQGLFDDFNESKINTDNWEILNTKWGENPSKGKHGGVVPDNVYIQNGDLVVRALGDNYKGPVKGHGQNTKVGGVIATKEKFASGIYEVRARICPRPGALSAFWTYYYENESFNHEIDFEFPGRNQAPYKPDDSDLTWGLFSNWRGISEDEHRTADKYLGNQVDGEYHLYRFNWHAGSETEEAKIEWYYDDKLIHQSNEQIPDHPSQFFVGIWFPWWISEANFDIDYMYIDWVKITPY
ncbi:glycoside hydrolase family 16 protein [Arenibacter sp. ARW7G5Y1]|uniref:glycoside hydrolase family 16 protein n=1 Tax=Arenibacter sp. ARW7G5Y1 TaxID=2135619 RepID=UPI000D76E961|nr:glycoside hydrolase family 16 protein [Arenibacter sp. ARW7G5Y1]PXX30613.1 glycosyl hydrolase family 16 [Arenibacter sp. ARW7G5Y1]